MSSVIVLFGPLCHQVLSYGITWLAWRHVAPFTVLHFQRFSATMKTCHVVLLFIASIGLFYSVLLYIYIFFFFAVVFRFFISGFFLSACACLCVCYEWKPELEWLQSASISLRLLKIRLECSSGFVAISIKSIYWRGIWHLARIGSNLLRFHCINWQFGLKYIRNWSKIPLKWTLIRF